jgi:hypothetical protein
MVINLEAKEFYVYCLFYIFQCIQCLMDKMVSFFVYILLHLFNLDSGTGCLQKTTYSFEGEL